MSEERRHRLKSTRKSKIKESKKKESKKKESKGKWVTTKKKSP
jgi:hypothetical protein